MNDGLTLIEASKWIKKEFNLDVEASNILYLVQYGRIRKINGSKNGDTKVSKEDLFSYYS